MPILSFIKAHRWWFLGPILFVGLIILIIAIALPIISPKLTPSIEGDAFRAELDKQTSKGLHFKGQYGKITRTGFDTASTPEFHATDGVKAMKSLDAKDIKAKFNPWGILLRRWQLDYVHIKSGEVEIQTYEPKPDNKPPKPWYSIFMPDRVYLREVICEKANVTWRIKDKPGGIYGTRVMITPYNRDFEYFAEGGTMKNAGLAPDLGVKNIHLLITKKVLRVYDLRLYPKDRESGSISVLGEMGMRDDKHVNMELKFEGIPIAPWLPDDVQKGVSGLAEGEVQWKGSDQTIEDSYGEGRLKIKGGELSELPILEFLASATAKKSLKTVKLTSCSVKFRWKHPKFEITELNLEGEEKVAIRGTVAVTKNGVLSGQLDLGLAPTYLEWLPKAQEEIFTRKKNGLIWTKVKLSGTLKEPQNDLTPRLAEALKKDPAAAAGLFLRGAGEWIEQKVKGN